VLKIMPSSLILDISFCFALAFIKPKKYLLDFSPSSYHFTPDLKDRSVSCFCLSSSNSCFSSNKAASILLDLSSSELLFSASTSLMLIRLFIFSSNISFCYYLLSWLLQQNPTLLQLS
jgi:hypothetical protein